MTEFETKLVMDNLDLVDRVIRTRITFRTSSVLMSFEDLQGVGREALCRAAIHYRPQKGEFEPFAGRCIYHALIDHCRKENAVLNATADCEESDAKDAVIEQETAYVPSYESAIDCEQAKRVFREYREKYSGVARLGIEAIELKALGFGAKEIADRYGTTVNNVNAWIARARSKLRSDGVLMSILQ